jgi:apolipoprotein N-acyltransferase
MKRFLQVFCAVFSGTVFGLSISNEFVTSGSPILGIFALLPLYLAISNTTSYRFSALLCGIQAFVCHLISSFWLAKIEGYAIFTLGASAIGTAIEFAIMGILIYLPFSKKNALSNNSRQALPRTTLRIFWFAGIYTLYEWIKSNGFLAYPWGTIYMSSYECKNLIQIVDIFGVYGITFLFAFVSSFTAEVLLFLAKKPYLLKAKEHKSNLKMIGSTMFVIFVLFELYGAFQNTINRVPQKSINTILIQQNLDPWKSNDKDGIAISKRLTESKINAFKEKNQKVDLVVWSEAVLQNAFPNSYYYYSTFPEDESLISFIRRMNTPFIIGAPYIMDEDKELFANAAVVIDSEGMMRGYYGKRHLVPFAEAIPFMEYEWMQNLMESLVGFSKGWSSGLQFTLFDINARIADNRPLPKFRIVDTTKPASYAENAGFFEDMPNQETPVRISIPICFEDAFPEICSQFHKAKSEVFFNITDDSWSMTKSAEYQHFIMAYFRAIEYRTTLVRSTNSGYTAVVDPSGKIIADLPLFTESSLAVTIPVYQWQRTFYSVFGSWFCLLLFLFALVYCVYYRLF